MAQSSIRADPGRRQRGAVLLILLSIVALSMASVLMGAFSRNNRDRRAELRTFLAMAEARDALAGFAASRGRLPRPAISAVDGRERTAPCDSERSCTGFLPWVTLGVERADGWGNLLHYSVTPALTATSVNLTYAFGSKTVLQRDQRGILRYQVGQDLCDISAPCAPLVIYSSGKKNLGTSYAGIAQPNESAGNTDELNNFNATSAFIGRGNTDDSASHGGQFDDLVTWLPLKTVLNRIAMAPPAP